jgi:hypothetical protein
MNYKQELELLKEEVRKQKRINKISTFLFASVFLLGATNNITHFNNITVNRLAVIDSNGIERVILEADNDTVNVPAGTLKRAVTASGIILQNDKGHEVSGYGSLSNGMAALILDNYSDDHKWGSVERIGMYSSPNGDAGLFLKDLSQNSRLEMKSKGSGEIDFWYK